MGPRHPIHAVNGRLASHAGTAQMDLLWHADALADTTERRVRAAWDLLWKSLPEDRPWEAPEIARRIFSQLYRDLVGDLSHGLRNLATWSHSRVAGYLAGNVPLPYLNVALAPHLPLLSALPPVKQPIAVTEAEPGLAALTGGGVNVAIADLVHAQDLGDEAAARDIFKAILFQPPPLQRVQQIVFGGSGGVPWTERLRSETKLAAPDIIANVFSAAYSAGLTPRQIAQQLQPVVGEVSATARRIARTEGMRVAHEIQQHANKAIANLILGQQVHAQLDQNTRPRHAARNGTIYYLDPKPGQKGQSEMPHPPMEADGTVAHNCRCWLSVVLMPPAAITSNPASMDLFDRHAAKAIPDPHVYGEWFLQAPERIRRRAVGSARYTAAVDKLGTDNPSWSYFWNPSKNRLLTAREIKLERPRDFAKRVEKVRKQQARQQMDLAKVATYGFLPAR